MNYNAQTRAQAAKDQFFAELFLTLFMFLLAFLADEFVDEQAIIKSNGYHLRGSNMDVS